jgi:hypothetical protein
MAQHVGSQSVAKLMCSRSWGVDASALERVPNNGTDATCSAKAGDRRLRAQEYPAAGTMRSAVLQICSDRLADVGVQR